MIDPSRIDEINDIIQHNEEFDVIPANKAMDALKDMTQVASSEMRLKIASNELETDYDFILIDCPPDLSQTLDNALLAAENLLIPVEPTRRSIRAIEKMNEGTDYLESSFPSQIDQIRIRGITVNAVEPTPNNDTREMLEFFNDAPYPMFEVPERVAIRRAWNNGTSIFQHEDPAQMEAAQEAYLEIAESLTAEQEVTA
jgi:chromosome partitioning protein